MEEAGLTSAAMAEELGVSRATITRWFADDRAPIRAAYLRQWAQSTGVPYEWLTEDPVTDPTGPRLGSEPTVTLPRTHARGGLSRPHLREAELVSAMHQAETVREALEVAA